MVHYLHSRIMEFPLTCHDAIVSAFDTSICQSISPIFLKRYHQYDESLAIFHRFQLLPYQAIDQYMIAIENYKHFSFLNITISQLPRLTYQGGFPCHSHSRPWYSRVVGAILHHQESPVKRGAKPRKESTPSYWKWLYFYSYINYLGKL